MAESNGSKKSSGSKDCSGCELSLLGGYRHEFGSLIKATGTHNDFVLHLIATHHSSGRPFFRADAYSSMTDKTQCARVAREAEQRFARLQHQFGPWGLAYLEAIFKRADGLVSAEQGDGASE